RHRRRQRPPRSARRFRRARRGDPSLLRRRGAARPASSGGAGLGRRLRARAGVRPDRGTARGGGRVKERPKLLMVGRTRYRLPLNETLRIKFDALTEQGALRVLASGVDGAPKHDDVFELAGPWRPRRLDGILYFLTLPSLSRRELRRHPPDAVLV